MEDTIRPLLGGKAAAIMGIVNTTPDTFSDGGRFLNIEDAYTHAMTLVDQGADILDIGGESTRPGAQPVGLQEELDRVLPVIERLANATDVPLSIDTYKPQVMLAAVKAGASMINDINGLRAEGALEAAATVKVPICLMHMQGEPKDMQAAPDYQDVIKQVSIFFRERLDQCIKHGIAKRDVILDPGIGFGKTLQHNLALLNNIESLNSMFGCEMLIGVSRKSLIDQLFGRSVEQRLPASLGLAVQAVLNGVKIARVHDVRSTVDAIRAVEAVVHCA